MPLRGIEDGMLDPLALPGIRDMYQTIRRLNQKKHKFHDQEWQHGLNARLRAESGTVSAM